MDIRFLYDDKSYMRYAMQLTKDRAYDADDLIQDVAERLIITKRYHSLPQHQIKSLARIMIRNLHYSNVKSKHIRNKTDYFEHEVKFEHRIVEQIDARLQLNKVSAKIAELHPHIKSVLLSHSNGATYSELSKVYDKPINTLLSDAFKARKFIKGEMPYFEPRKKYANV